ncbi:uncharacterized protein F4822DRAFT_441018 [Hypoxylon trugodes]|uniref:uncharacterized protein n=1 Tax=Hypoxylon trugodes TaxID=326681 RepID=UPI00219C9D5D|nr:uncharacterized protein F4822DRAFT_441018 [Hypoxylon trugodes]KAI1382600.1 hypothetical protein F4822DRAFT_441018 [Hypoxylon trugodes]
MSCYEMDVPGSKSVDNLGLRSNVHHSSAVPVHRKLRGKQVEDSWVVIRDITVDGTVQPLVASPAELYHDSWSQATTLTPTPSPHCHQSVLDWNLDRMRTYVRMVQEIILPIYPVVAPREMDTKVATFFCQLSASHTTAGQKRKSTSVTDEPHPFTPGPMGFPTEANALVLLVLSLGQLLSYKGDIPKEDDDYFTLAKETGHIGCYCLAHTDAHNIQQGHLTYAAYGKEICLAFWACLKLESDITGGSPLPRSGLFDYAAQIPHPGEDFLREKGFPESSVRCFSAQLDLEKLANRAAIVESRSVAMDDYLQNVQGVLQDFRNISPVLRDHGLKRGEPETPLAHNTTRYWSSKASLLQPFLRIFLEKENHYDAISVKTMGAEDSLAVQALEALVNSIWAYHAIDSSKQTLITSFLATAPAQRVNLLLLVTCYRDQVLRSFISRERISALFTKTIALFYSMPQPSGQLMADMNIIVSQARDLGFLADHI